MSQRARAAGANKKRQQEERRGAPRARVHLFVTEFRGKDTFRHPVVYLSATGMLIRDASFTLDRLLDTPEIDLDLTLPGRRSHFRIRGRIAHVEPTEQGEPGVGIEFLGLSKKDAETIDAYVQGVLDGRSAARSGGH